MCLMTETLAPVELIESAEQITACYPAFLALRPHLKSADELVRRIDLQQEAGYQVAGIAEGEVYVSVVGFRPMDTLAWGRIIYIDDLSTVAEARGKGYAGRLLDYVRALAIEQNCDAVHLDSGYTRLDAHRLYLNKGYVLSAHHFALNLH
jgi:GNAT superfamily N-acetyltransferase